MPAAAVSDTVPTGVDGDREAVTVRLIGGPTTLVEIGGLRLLTDPAFDASGPIASGTRPLTRTRPPAVPVGGWQRAQQPR